MKYFQKVNFLVHFSQIDPELYNNKKFKIDANVALNILEKSLPYFNDLNEWIEDKLHETIITIANKLETKSGQVYTALRIAFTGVAVTPGGSVEMADILGKEETLRRLNLAIDWLKQ